MSIFYLIYTSKISLRASLRSMTFHDLCHESADNNAKVDITGILCFKQGNFLQYLEGSESTVNQLYETIKTDHRHKSIRLIATGQSPHRLFSHWNMHCINLDKLADIDDISPVLDYFETPMLDKNNVPTLLADLENYYQSGKWQHQHHTDFVKGSYSRAKMHHMGTDHRYFLWMQLGFLIIFLLLGMYWLLNR